MIMFYFILGTLGADMILILFVIHGQPLSEMIENAVTELNKLVHQKKASKAMIHFIVRNIIMMHKENNKYENPILDN